MCAVFVRVSTLSSVCVFAFVFDYVSLFVHVFVLSVHT